MHSLIGREVYMHMRPGRDGNLLACWSCRFSSGWVCGVERGLGRWGFGGACGEGSGWVEGVEILVREFVGEVGGLETWWTDGCLERGKWRIGGEGMVFGLMCRNWVSFVRFGEGARGEVAGREGRW